jgi:hypothetical protein
MAGFAPTPALGSSSLRWVRSLLPGEEGRAWWAEVISCLSEITEPAQRRQYVRSYRRSVPQLVWTSWTSGVRGVAPAGAGYRSVDWKGTTIENFDPEEKFGIKEQGGPGPRSLDQKYPYFSVLQHWFLGSLGYPDGLHELHQDTSRAIFGLFQANGFHNLIYLARPVLATGSVRVDPSRHPGDEYRSRRRLTTRHRTGIPGLLVFAVHPSRD